MSLHPVEWIIGMAALALWGVGIWAVVDAVWRPGEVWRRAGQPKGVWVGLMVVMLLVIPPIGWILGFVYLVVIRPKLRAAASGPGWAPPAPPPPAPPPPSAPLPPPG